MDRGENGVGIDPRATTTCVCSKVTARGVFIGLGGRSAGRDRRDGIRNVYLLETQDVIGLGIVSRNNVGLAKLLSEGNALSQ